MMRITARRMKAMTEPTWRSKSRARRLLWLIYAKVRSTIHRFGIASKRGTSARLTICRRQVPVLATVAAIFGP